MKNPFEFQERQKYTSAATSINAVKLPIIYKRIRFQADYIFDYGCGRYIDHIQRLFPAECYLPFDPYNQPAEKNRRSWNIVEKEIKAGRRIDVVCSNVLNVIDNEKLIQEISYMILGIVKASKGSAYIKVHEGDRSGIGKQTGIDTYQRNELTIAYLRYFPKAKLKYSIIQIDGGSI